MNEREQFVSSAFVIPPLDIFEGVEDPPLSLFRNCEKLASADPPGFTFWLKTALSAEQAHFAFFGGAVYGKNPADLDVLSFVTATGYPIHFRKPDFVHIVDVREFRGNIARDWGTFFVHTLIFPFH